MGDFERSAAAIHRMEGFESSGMKFVSGGLEVAVGMKLHPQILEAVHVWNRLASKGDLMTWHASLLMEEQRLGLGNVDCQP